MNYADVAIVGGGHSGAQCAIALRQNGFPGTITIIGREPEYPYERPALSKEYFAGKKTFERLYIKTHTFWAEKNVKFLLGTEVSALDPQARTLSFSDGGQFGYGTLVWAAGGDPRRLSCPGADLKGVHAVRTRADCDVLMGEISAGARNIVIVGGGYVGLEAAAVLTKMGVTVTLLAQTRVLTRACEELSNYYQRKHRHHGVDLRTGVEVGRIEGKAARVASVVLSDGARIAADAVIVGIGIVPAVAPLIAAGARGENGVEVDEHCRTSLPHVHAIGDCAAFTCHYAGGRTMRVESVQNANDMATCVAKFICGEAKPYNALPWFWSNQYDLRLQTAGINTGFDSTVMRGDPDEGAFSVIYLKNGRVLALDCVNAVKDYVQGRKLVEAGAAPDVTKLADTRVPLKDLLVQD